LKAKTFKKKKKKKNKKMKKRWIESRVRKRQGDAGVGGKNPQKSNEIGGHRRRTTPNGDEIIRVAHYIQKERRRRRRRRQRNKTRKDCWLH
jgi:hypothetical protein